MGRPRRKSAVDMGRLPSGFKQRTRTALSAQRITKDWGPLVCTARGRDTDVRQTKRGLLLRSGVGEFGRRSPSYQAQLLRPGSSGAQGGKGISPQGDLVSRQPATGVYFTLIGCLATAVVLSMVASSFGLALALVENSFSTDCRWKLFIAQKGIRRALFSLSGTP